MKESTKLKNLIKYIVKFVIRDKEKYNALYNKITKSRLWWLINSLYGKRYFFGVQLKLSVVRIGSAFGGQGN
jgi:hypothetical protein